MYHFLVEFSSSTGHIPSLQEIADHFGYASTTSARDHLRALEKKGAIERDPGKARSLRICEVVDRMGEKSEGAGGIPILGGIAAGIPIEAIEQCDRFLPMPGSLFGGRDVFALEVRGESMVEEGILDGDIAVIERCEDVPSGEIAAVLVDEEATLKRIIREKNGLLLRAANPRFPDISIRPESGSTVRIVGRYLGLVRSTNHGEALVA